MHFAKNAPRPFNIIHMNYILCDMSSKYPDLLTFLNVFHFQRAKDFFNL
nr:MAG TPA: hypothetical protein [Caudoviricetes sp.]